MPSEIKPEISPTELTQVINDTVSEILNRVQLQNAQSESEFAAILKVVILSLFIERFLALFFEHRWIMARIEARGLKEFIALFVSILACWWWDISALASMTGTIKSTLWPDYILTAAVVAGGSKVSVKLFRDYLGVRSQFSRQYEEERRARIDGLDRDVSSVLHVQDYLTAYGYLPAPSRPATGNALLSSPSVIPGKIDVATQNAVKRLQARLGLPQSGIPDQELLKVLMKPRCGMMDSDPALSGQPSWGTQRSLTWRLTRTPETIYPEGGAASAAIRCNTAVESAFNAWAGKLRDWSFVQSASPDQADILIEWVNSDPDNQLRPADVGHATFPNMGERVAIHLRREAWWSDDGATDCYDIQSVVLHEIGHCLGIVGHPAGPADVMGSTIFRGREGLRRDLSPTDLAALTLIYGRGIV